MNLIEALGIIPTEVRHVRITTAGDKCTAVASLAEGQIAVTFITDSKVPDFAVDGRIVRLARAVAPTARVSFKGKKIRVADHHGEYSFSTIPPEAVPVVKEPTAWSKVPTNCGEFRSALAYVSDAAASNDIRHYLNGVFVRVSDRVEVVATNGNALAVAVIPCTGASEPREIILSNKTASELQRLLSRDSEIATIEIGVTDTNSNMIRLTNGNVVYTAIGFDARYPDFTRVSDDHEPSSSAQFVTSCVLESIDRLKLTVATSAPGISLAMTCNAIKLTSNADPDKGGTETVEAEAPFADHVECGINLGYLDDAVKAAEATGKSVTIGWQCAEKALTIRPTTPDGDGPAVNRRWIVMPCKV